MCCKMLCIFYIAGNTASSFEDNFKGSPLPTLIIMLTILVQASSMHVYISQSRNQCEIRHHFVISTPPSHSLLWSAWLQRIMRMQGHLGWLGYQPTHTHTHTQKHLWNHHWRSREMVKGGRILMSLEESIRYMVISRNWLLLLNERLDPKECTTLLSNMHACRWSE